MRLSKAILLMAIVAALPVYAVECPPVVTPTQMMNCCKTMPCPHGKNCCKAKSMSHRPFIGASAQKATAPPAVRAAISPAYRVHAAGRAPALAIARPHAPPGELLSTTSVPLRI